MRMTANRTGNGRRIGIAWVAVLALLINALVPASWAAAAGQSGQPSSGWCGTGRHGDAPLKAPAPSLCDRCLLCVAPASGLEPPVPTRVGTPARIATPIRLAVTMTAVAKQSPYDSAQPRGPPICIS